MAKKSYFNIHVKAVSDADEGTFVGKLSTYGNVDYGNDVVEAGAFDNSIAVKGDTYPLLWQHCTHEPIGQLQIVGTEDALVIKAKLNLEVARAKEAYALLKAGDIDGLSMGYWPTRFNYDQDGIRHLTEVELFEGSVVTFPMDPEATVTGVKNMAEKNDDALDGAVEDIINEAVEKVKAVITDAVKRCQKAKADDAPDEEGADKEPSGEEKENDEEGKSLLMEISTKLGKFTQ